ncbi:IS5/IS1182 family transposase, partial [Klebsiella pneumoniae]
MEDSLYEIASMHLFTRVSLDSALPDRTTIMNFRKLCEQPQMPCQLFKPINRSPPDTAAMMTQATPSYFTSIYEPVPTQHQDQHRDPEMLQA